MDKAHAYHCVRDDIISKCPHQLEKTSLHLSHSMRNSAPSRLEHLDDFSLGSFEKHLTKSNSLVTLFHSHSSHYHGSSQEESRNPNQGAMSAPSNSQTGSDNSTPPSPWDQKQLKFFPKIFSDPNNNEDLEVSDEYETISQTSSTSLEPADSHRYCPGTHSCSDAKNRISQVDMNGFYDETLASGVPRISAGRAFDDVVIADVADTVDSRKHSAESISAELASGRGQCDNDDDLESLSSISSDDTFVGDDVLEENKPPVVYRSYSDSTVLHNIRKLSLENGKRRKSVHFADTIGYELEIHIPISQSDDYFVPPKLKEALKKLRAANQTKDDSFFSLPTESYRNRVPQRMLVLNFQQPFLEPTFRSRVDRQNVCLESISVLPNSLSFTGVVRVTNIEFEKKVFVRYTADTWL